MSELWQPGGNSTEQCTHSEPPGPKYTIGANLQSLFFGKSKAKGQKFMFIVYVQSNQAIGSRSGGWSSSQILLKSISLGFTSSSSLLFSLLSNWFSFLSEPSFLPLSVSRILRGGGTYPTFGRWTTRKPRNEISTKPGHSPTSKLPKRVSHTIFMDTVGPQWHCSSCSKWFLTLLTPRPVWCAITCGLRSFGRALYGDNLGNKWNNVVMR